MAKKRNPKAPLITVANKIRMGGVPEVKSYHIHNEDLQENLKALMRLAKEFKMESTRYNEDSGFFTLDAFGDTPPVITFVPEIEPLELRMVTLYMRFELVRGTSHVFTVQSRLLVSQSTHGLTLAQVRILEHQLEHAHALQAYIDLVFAGKHNFTTLTND